jgi:hypothetical protein
MIEYLYRYESWYSGNDVKLSLHSYEIIKRTKCGAWIGLYPEKSKFINLNARKQWACETKELALVSFIARKRRQTQILYGQYRITQLTLELARKKLNGDENDTINSIFGLNAFNSTFTSL